MMKKHKTLILVILLLVIVFFAFLPSLKNGFVHWDDYYYIVDNVAIKFLSLNSIGIIFTSFFSNEYYPLTMLSYALDHRFYGLAPYGYHLTNLILHLVNCVLVFWLIFLLSESLWAAFITATLFAVHPMRVESVAWIGERKDVIYAIFFLGSMVAYFFYLKGRNRLIFYCSAILLFFLSILSKAMAITLPFVLMLVDYLLGRRYDKNAFIDKIPFLILSFLSGVATVLSRGLNGSVLQGSLQEMIAKFVFAAQCLGFYLSKIFAPVHLSCLYAFPKKTFAVTAVIVLIAIAGMLPFFIFRRSRSAVFGMAFFLITILPGLQFVPVVSKAVVADRFSYLPSIGLFFIIGQAFKWAYERNSRHTYMKQVILVAGLILTVTFLALSTHKRCEVWKDDISLWGNALREDQDNLLAYHNMADEYFRRGEFDKVVTSLTEALRIDPKDTDAYNNRGMAYFRKGKFDEAISDFTKLLKLDPCNMLALNNRAVAYSRKGDLDSAITDFSKSIKIYPGAYEAYYGRGVVYSLKDEPEQALGDFNKAIKINPDYIEARLKRSIVYYYKKEYASAWEDLCAVERSGEGGRIDPAFSRKLKKRLRVNHYLL